MSGDRQVNRERRPARSLDGRASPPEQAVFSGYDRQPQRHDIRHGQPAATGHRLSRQYLPASPHRAGHFAGIHPEDAPYTTGDDIEVGEADEALYPRSHSSAIRYNQPAAAVEKRVRYEFRPGQTIPRRAHAVSPGGTNTTGDVPGLIPQKRAHAPSWLLYIGVGMLAMLALWAGLHTLLSWWQVRSDDSTYGYPRTYQFDAVVGHSDSRNNPTHIIIINLNRHIVVIELPGGDLSHARIYSGPTLFGDGQDVTPVTGKALDVNSDGKPDLILYVQDQRIVFINDGAQFRPLKPGERVAIPQ